MSNDTELFELLPVNGGHVAKVDKNILLKIPLGVWHLNGEGYAVTNTASGSVYLHNVVMGEIDKNGKVVDHINGDKLDNRRSNLRLITRQQNNMNRGANKVRKDTHYKGVILHESGKWQARIGIDGKKVYLGYFKTPEDAARAYNDAALKHHGEYAKLNDLDIELAELKHRVEGLTGWDLKQPDLTSYLLEKLPQEVHLIKTDLKDEKFRYYASTKIKRLSQYSDTPLKALLKLVIALDDAGVKL